MSPKLDAFKGRNKNLLKSADQVLATEVEDVRSIESLLENDFPVYVADEAMM